MDIWKNGNLRQWKFEEKKSGKMDIAKNKNREKLKLGENKLEKLDIRKNCIWGKWKKSNL